LINFSYAVWLTVSGLIAFLVAWLGWRRRTAAGALPLLALMLSLAVWSFTYAALWLSVTVEARAFWLYMTYCGVVSAPVAFFVLVQVYIGRGEWLTKRTYLLLSIIPVLTLFFLWTDPLHGLFFGLNHTWDESTILSGGAWFYIFVLYSYGLMAVSVVLLFRTYMRSPQFYRQQTRIVLGGALLPWLANFLMLLGWNPLPGLDLTPIAFTGTGLLLAYGFFGYRMMELVPVGRDVLVENIDDAIVVVDTDGRIVDINPKAMEYSDPGLDLPFGRPFMDVFSRWGDIIPNYAALEGRAEIRLDRPPFSFFELKIIPLKDRHERAMGKLIAWRDITAHKQAEEKLRIFFHTVEQNPVAIMITTPDGSIEYVNPHFVRLTGYTLNELHGKSPRVLRSGETTSQIYENLWATIKSGQVWQGEILNRKKNGETFWVHEMIAPVLDDNGNATNFVSMQQDITASKHAEVELRVVNTRLQMQLSEIESLHDQLREEAIRDGLTHLFNRRYMEETLEREVSRGERDPHPISVVMMDVDLFKSINDTFGHQAGDAVLQTLGTILLENTRISDIACRFGGDEMLVVMPGATQEIALGRAEEWRQIFSKMTFNFGDEQITTTLSLGVASFPDQARNPIELLTAADKAMYWAKEKRNHVVLYDPSMMARKLNRSDDIR
jgi:diguanylate cyclase (GGDEF)-like protein/PAS domain S-box-containing protein